jgi:hypothetical protein
MFSAVPRCLRQASAKHRLALHCPSSHPASHTSQTTLLPALHAKCHRLSGDSSRNCTKVGGAGCCVEGAAYNVQGVAMPAKCYHQQVARGSSLPTNRATSVNAPTHPLACILAPAVEPGSNNPVARSCCTSAGRGGHALSRSWHVGVLYLAQSSKNITSNGYQYSRREI